MIASKDARVGGRARRKEKRMSYVGNCISCADPGRENEVKNGLVRLLGTRWEDLCLAERRQALIVAARAAVHDAGDDLGVGGGDDPAHPAVYYDCVIEPLLNDADDEEKLLMWKEELYDDDSTAATDPRVAAYIATWGLTKLNALKDYECIEEANVEYWK
jgi:hypothetical protein